jgi:hypothetical protein
MTMITLMSIIALFFIAQECSIQGIVVYGVKR